MSAATMLTTLEEGIDIMTRHLDQRESETQLREFF